jgi:malonate transporter and related proteins
VNGFADIFTIIVPVFLVIALGFLTGRLHWFDGERAQALRDLTMQLALPASLFLGIATTPRHVLLGEGPLVLLLAAGLIGLYGLVFCVLRFVLRRPVGRSALLALACVQPQYAFMGTSILGGLFGTAQAAIPIAVAGILVNVVLDPAVLVLIGLGDRQTAGRAAVATPAEHEVHARVPALVGTAEGSMPAGVEPSGPRRPAPVPEPRRRGTADLLSGLVRPLREPFAWAPLLGLVVALLGIHPPGMLDTSLGLVGQASSAVALVFVGVSVAKTGRPALSAAVIGIVLMSVVVQPLVTYGLGRLLTSGAIAAQAALITAFPVSPVPMMLASRHGTKDDEQLVSSAVVISLVLSFLTLPLIVNLTG